MSTVTLRLLPETEQKLRAKANQLGLTVETFLQELAERAAATGSPPSPPAEPLGLLKWPGTVIRTLSREDIYDDVS
jgi:hypothetical protein